MINCTLSTLSVCKPFLLDASSQKLFSVQPRSAFVESSWTLLQLLLQEKQTNKKVNFVDMQFALSISIFARVMNSVLQNTIRYLILSIQCEN